MNRYALVALGVLLPLSGCGLVTSMSGVRGSGQVVTESRDVSGIRTVAFDGVGDVKVRQTGQERLQVRAEDNLVPLLTSRVENGVLHLGTAPGVSLRPTQPMEFVLEVKTLEGIKLGGAGTMEATGLDTPRLSVTLSGAGRVKVAGKGDDLIVTLSGAGAYEGADFATRRATVRSSGVGSAVVNAREELDVTLSGVGSVEYLGSPKVKKSVTGVGTVKAR